MTLSSRDKRALSILAGVLALGGIVWIATAPPKTPKVVARQLPVADAEKRLVQLRRIAAGLPGEEQVWKQASIDLAQREKGLIQADTAAQAQAQLLQILKRIGHNANPPVEFRQVELGQPEPYGDAYGMVFVSVTFDCGIEQLVDMLADLTAAPELVATDQLRIGSAQPKQKTLPVRLTVSGVVPRRLIPTRKSLAQF